MPAFRGVQHKRASWPRTPMPASEMGAQTPKLADLSNHDWGVTPHATKSPRVVITNAHEKAVVQRGRRLNGVPVPHRCSRAATCPH